MRDDISQLELLERLNRMRPDELDRLNEYRRLLKKILVLPGFEFTATFGFHILGIFSPQTPLRLIEHALLELGVPHDQLDTGATTVGSTSDVLTAYRVIDENGGLAIAAHINSKNGVAMRDFPFGGQTKIAYTQDVHLHALEATDLDLRGRYTTASFFNGSKPEYPRRMHVIQGSDAHRLTRDPRNPKNYGIGDRMTEVQLPEVSFEGLKALFQSDDFSRTRPFTGSGEAVDFIQMAREEGPSIVQAFYPAATKRGGYLDAIVCDVCAMANTNGGTIYIGVSADSSEKPAGISNTSALVTDLEQEIDNKITPALECKIDTIATQGKTVVRLTIPRGGDLPYVIGDNQIYIRDEGETALAVRDEIVRLVLRGRGLEMGMAVTESPILPSAPMLPVATPVAAQPVVVAPPTATSRSRTPREARPTSTPAPVAIAPVAAAETPPAAETGISPPGTGVEVVASEIRGGTRYYVMRDLRNGNTVTNVTKGSARRLWAYAISEHEATRPEQRTMQWQAINGDEIGLVKRTSKGGLVRYDLAQRSAGKVRIFYGVTPDGIDGPWKMLVGDED